MKTFKLNDLVRYSHGEMGEVESILMFSELITLDLASRLGGVFDCDAENMISSGILDNKGKILVDLSSIN